LIHGDYHPENIIFKSSELDKIKVIDFTDLALGDPMVDLGSFIQQFDFMCFEILDRKKINSLKINFLENYFLEKFENIDIQYINRINFFQAWVVMRTTILLFYAKSAKHPLGELISEIERYLSLAENSERKINLY
jgi:aminoglycoside phosphotransferase (APT) family kinase protein